ncbi:hypothetical protein [Micromonospora sp. NPDC049274]|uniref:hypothetical protein n=1 Tax=Micromonospora sp. NPDC049274 TaxID=3154829 RepID=UPI0034400F6C
MGDAHLGDHPSPAITAARATITECDAKPQRYRAALDAGADPSTVSKWMDQTQAERIRAESELHGGTSAAPRQMTQAEITTLVQTLGNIVTVLRDADPTDKAEVCRQLGLRLTYHP